MVNFSSWDLMSCGDSIAGSMRMTFSVHTVKSSKDALSLLTACRASEHLSFVPEVPEIVIGFRSFRQRRDRPAIRAGRFIVVAYISWIPFLILHASYPKIL